MNLASHHRTSSHQLAPLASLDCSITEPITDTHTSTTDTPTLSGYFECDQLSDMVDDSLFEITNAGCLSKSVFTNQTFKQQQQQLLLLHQSSYSLGAQRNGNLEEDCRRKQEEVQVISYSNALLAKCQPHEFNGSTTLTNLPTQGRRKQLTTDETNCSISSFHRTRSNRLIEAPAKEEGNAKRSGQEREPVRAAASVSDKRNKRPSTHRRPRNNPAEAPKEPEVPKLCSACEQEAALLAKYNKSVLFRPKKQKKSRFSFGLFNLFTASTSDEPFKSNELEDNDERKRGEPCRHMKFASQQHQFSPATTGARLDEPHQNLHRASRTRSKGSLDTNSCTAQIKSRDSIKFTHQRRQRVNSNSNSNSRVNGDTLNSSKSCIDFDQTIEPPATTELLLLDPSDGSSRLLASSRLEAEQQSNLPLKTSHSSYIISSLNDTNKVPLTGLPELQSTAHATIRKQRQTKSVKFTVPDKVMLMPSTSSNSYKTPKVLGSTTLPSRADLLPLAPIIKRVIPKSSSYSQTESSKYLDELLAKYEDNHELIREINEKLKLTETIASPISVLDIESQEAAITTITPTSSISSNMQRQPPQCEQSVHNIQFQTQLTQTTSPFFSSTPMVGQHMITTSCDSGSTDPINLHTSVTTQNISSGTEFTTHTIVPEKRFNEQRAFV